MSAHGSGGGAEKSLDLDLNHKYNIFVENFQLLYLKMDLISSVGDFGVYFLYFFFILLIFLILGWTFSPQVYDWVILHMTKMWYKELISRLPVGARVLDVGIGTGSALLENVDAVLAKRLYWIGLDIDSNYVKHCRQALSDSKLRDCSAVLEADIYDSNALSSKLNQIIPPSQSEKKVLFDAVYFSGSFSLLPQPALALEIAKGMLRPGGRIYITQTFQHKSLPLFGIIKPALKYFTTIDFGRLFFTKDVAEIIRNGGLTLVSMDVIKGSVDTKWQSAFILVCE